MISPARKVSYRLLRKIASDRVFSDDALNSEAVGGLDIRDRHLTTEIVYGSLRWQGTLDYLLAEATSRPWQEVDERARVLLRMSLYQMWRMDRIPDHALINDAVEIAKREMGRGIDKYLNGVLRHFSRTRPWAREDFLKGAPAWARVSLPQWLWKRWASRFGKSAAAEYALSLNRPPQTAVRLDGNELGALPFDAVKSDLVPGAALRLSESAERNESIHYQDEGSQLIPHLLGGIDGWRVWDACAAPGGKSAVLRNLCGKSGLMVASDLRSERVLRLAHILSGRGTKGAAVLVADASKSAPFRAMFDAVIADVPCSGLGTLRRNPEIKWRFDPGAGFQTLQHNQIQILESVSECVRPGGRLLYSTCSTEPEENEQVIESFLRAHPGFRLERPDWPPGIEIWTGDDGIVRTFPSSKLWDGFFAALMVRNQ